MKSSLDTGNTRRSMLSHVERGQGPALLLLHAFPLDHTMWLPQMEAFSPSFRVIAPDVIGFGGSQPTRPWTMGDMADEVASLLSTLGIDQCCLAGLSMGGYIALNFTLKYPERVSKLVFAHSRARGDIDAERQKRTDMIAALNRDGIRMLPDVMLGKLLRPNPSPEVAEWVKNTILTVDATAAAHAVTAMRERPDRTADLSTITCPTLVLSGASDATIPAEESQKVAAGLPTGRFVVIDEAGHLSNLENPQAFNKAVGEFLLA